MNEWVIVGIVAIAVIFGVNKLPDIARNLGRSQGEFKKGLKEGVPDDKGDDQSAAPPANSAPTSSSDDAPTDGGGEDS